MLLPRLPSDRALRFLKNAAGIAGVMLLMGGLYLGYQQLIGNFHPVIASELYRSGQPNAERLARYQRDHGIRTVINLRGASRAHWYVEEVEASKALGMTHIDFKMSAGKELSDERAAELLDIMEHAEKPILVHCNGGADRTGIASALYLAAIAKHGEMAAEWQLSLYYGHFSIPYFPAWPMDETFERMEPALGFHDS